jgi:hypothetical protein
MARCRGRRNGVACIPWPELNPIFREHHHAMADAKDRRNKLAWQIICALNAVEG